MDRSEFKTALRRLVQRAADDGVSWTALAVELGLELDSVHAHEAINGRTEEDD